MNKRTLKNVIILLILLIGVLITNTVFAAGSFSVNKDTATITEGNTTTFTIDGSSATGRVNITSSDTSVATVSSASAWLENSSSTITITAKKAGTATITISGKVSDSKGVEDTITKTIAVTVNAKSTDNGSSNTNTNTNANNGTTNNNSNTNTNTNSGTTTTTKSTNAYLSTLGVRLSESDASKLGVNVSAYDFSGFKKATLTYSVTVPYEVDSLKVSYKAAHSGATVNVTGNSGFEVGSNNAIKVVVTAEDGKTTKTYTIKVTKLAEEEEKPGNLIEDEEEGLYLTSLSIEGIDISPEFSKDTYAYTATLSKNLTEVEVKAEANKENASIEILGNTDLVVGENTINIVVKQEGSTTQTVYQINLTKEAIAVTTTGEDTDFMSSLISNIKNYVVIAVIVVVLVIAAVIILIVLLVKENKKSKNEETDEEYNVYENDENEFKDNNTEEVVEEPQVENVKKEEQREKVEETTNETETKNEGKRTRRKEKGRHSK